MKKKVKGPTIAYFLNSKRSKTAVYNAGWRHCRRIPHKGSIVSSVSIMDAILPVFTMS